MMSYNRTHHQSSASVSIHSLHHSRKLSSLYSNSYYTLSSLYILIILSLLSSSLIQHTSADCLPLPPSILSTNPTILSNINGTLPTVYNITAVKLYQSSNGTLGATPIQQAQDTTISVNFFCITLNYLIDSKLIYDDVTQPITPASTYEQLYWNDYYAFTNYTQDVAEWRRDPSIDCTAQQRHVTMCSSCLAIRYRYWCATTFPLCTPS